MNFIQLLPMDKFGNRYEAQFETYYEHKFRLKIVKNFGEVLFDKTFDLDFLMNLDDSIILALKKLTDKKDFSIGSINGSFTSQG